MAIARLAACLLSGFGPALTAFEPRCGHTQELGGCPGYADCFARLANQTEASFLQQQREVLTVPVNKLPAAPRCTRTSCLDVTRCTLPFRLFVYNASALAAAGVDPATVQCVGRQDAWDPWTARHLTDDPRRACALWITAQRACKAFKKITALPHWGNDGLNHVIFESTDRGIPPAMRAKYLGKAMVAQGFSTQDNFVHGVDVAVPIKAPARVAHTFARFQRSPPWERKWLLTFKGLASAGVRARLALHHDEPRRVIIAVYPSHHRCSSTGEALPVRSELHQLVPTSMPINHACCAQMRALYDHYDYDDLMNSTFGLVMPGRSPASYRLSEVLAAGTIPVFVGMDFAVLPFAELIPWSEIALSAPAHVDVRNALLPELRELAADREQLRRMQHGVRAAYVRYFQPVAGGNPYEHIKRTVVQILRRRFEFRPPFRTM
ncbi:hypothetical protein KFE25_006147 [Diacronema lutheri]|uniref:Exostosin GT47 domain-containing protein n=1 Tax=Diacronema lutheri TaxID=2081491 RepID=A0A8J5XW27_DIALT|nr:hypothetical protein KFE25_006147 [Diacronema lutheri]